VNLLSVKDYVKYLCWLLISVQRSKCTNKVFEGCDGTVLTSSYPFHLMFRRFEPTTAETQKAKTSGYLGPNQSKFPSLMI